jgi:hypothetical protein
MKKFALLTTLAAFLVGGQLLASQPAEARGWQHHMRDQYARQAAFNQNYGGYMGNAGYGWQNNFRVNPVRQFFGNANYPAYQNYGYGGYGSGYGMSNCR